MSKHIPKLTVVGHLIVNAEITSKSTEIHILSLSSNGIKPDLCSGFKIFVPKHLLNATKILFLFTIQPDTCCVLTAHSYCTQFNKGTWDTHVQISSWQKQLALSNKQEMMCAHNHPFRHSYTLTHSSMIVCYHAGLRRKDACYAPRLSGEKGDFELSQRADWWADMPHCEVWAGDNRKQ